MNKQRWIVVLGLLAVLGVAWIGTVANKLLSTDGSVKDAMLALSGGSSTESIVELGISTCRASKVDRAIKDGNIEKELSAFGIGWGRFVCPGDVSEVEARAIEEKVDAAVAEETLIKEVKAKVREELVQEQAAATAVTAAEEETEAKEQE